MQQITGNAVSEVCRDFNADVRAAGLNPSQRKFCRARIDKNIRLLAPAGSGKTMSLLWRCRYIQDQHRKKEMTDPRFLIVTFTRAAKLELETRLENSPEFQDLNALISTLNSWGWAQMKDRAGRELVKTAVNRRNLVTHDLLSVCRRYDRIYALVKQSKAQNTNGPVLMNMIDEMKNLGFLHTMKKKDFKAHLRYLKDIGLQSYYRTKLNDILRAEKVELGDRKAIEEAEAEFFSFWREAVLQQDANKSYTMDDQKYWARVRLEERVAAGKHAPPHSCFTHIMIDEFQDINPLDLSLIKAIAAYHNQGEGVGITISGDDDQAIFGWRGTTPNYILEPEKYFGSPFQTYVLDTNYRSPNVLVQASDKLIRYNKNRVEKEMKSAAKGRAYIKAVEKQTVSALDLTMRKIHELLEQKKCQNVAVICRRQAYLFPFQVLLTEENTPYYVDRDIDIFEGEAMKNLLNILQIIYRAKADDNDDPIGDLIDVLDKVDRYQIQTKEKGEIREYLEDLRIDHFKDAIEAFREYPRPIKKNDSGIFCDAVHALLRTETVYDFMNVLLDRFRGFDRDYTKAEQDTHYKNPQFDRMRDLAKRYGSDFRKFYRDIDRARKDVEISQRQLNDESGKGYQKIQETKIHLMTATRSKGKEFDAVIIPDCDEREWPSPRYEDIEEERRLFYVAMTRARRYLYFIIPGSTCTRFLLEAGVK